MELTLQGIGKKFHAQWLFRDVSMVIPSLSSLAITGKNGSGKSTLLQIIYRYVMPSKGITIAKISGEITSDESFISQTAFVSPYTELPEELTLIEAITFHFKMCTPVEMDFDRLIEACGLTGHKNKQIKYFSSGMKQRLKLALAFNTECNLLLLDEPCSNLDQQGVKWYCDTVQKLLKKRTIIIASNQEVEYSFCDKIYEVQGV